MTTKVRASSISRPPRRAISPVLCLGLALTASCVGKRTVATSTPPRVPVVDDVRPGECADSTRQGTFGDNPSLWHADRDLDGDDIAEIVVADRTLCDAEGNCHWNLYRKDGACDRYLGTVSGARVQRLSPRGEHGFVDLRVWWYLTSENRLLLQEYRYGRSGYRVIEAFLCTQADDDRIQCEERGR